jgi:predicted Zn-dependent peptidase
MLAARSHQPQLNQVWLNIAYKGSHHSLLEMIHLLVENFLLQQHFWKTH